jgi:hypothetical protein
MVKLECANCRMEKELPENLSVKRLNEETKQFYKEHKTRIGNAYCKIDNIFLRTFNEPK